MPNRHAAAVLDAYLDAEVHLVPHAVLVQGRWGSGKTHFLRDVYEPDRARRLGRDHVPFLFVSLFGATSAQDVEMRIFKAAYPGEAVAGGMAGTIALGIGEFLQVGNTAKGTVAAIGRRAVRRLREHVFVLDDLERVEPGAIGEVMGLVSSFVNQHSRRVILVADEEELRQRFKEYEWDRRAEKVIGRRAEIRPDFAGLATALASRLPEGRTRTFLRTRTGDILDVVAMSGTRNLRDLAWAYHNASRFADCLLVDRDIEESHVVRTVRVVLAVSLWCRSGPSDQRVLEHLPELSILMHMDSYAKRREEEPERNARIDVANDFLERFAALNVESPPVDYGTILDFEQGGVLDEDALRLRVKQRFGFGPDHGEPSWRVLWHSRERTFDQIERALDALAKELADRRYSEPGEILHVIGQAIRFGNFGEARLTGGTEIVSFFRRYIDDVRREGRLKPMADDPFGSEEGGGLGFGSTETDEFRELHGYLRDARVAVGEVESRRDVEAILQAFEEGRPDDLFRLMRNEDRLSRSPVLDGLDADRIADLFTRDPISLNAAGKLLAYRYNDITPNGPLQSELPWARRLATAIQERLAQWPDPHGRMGLDAFRGIIRHYERGRDRRFRVLEGIVPSGVAMGPSQDL